MLCIFSLFDLFPEVSVGNKNLLLLAMSQVWQGGALAGWTSVGRIDPDLQTRPPKALCPLRGLLGTSV